MQFKKEKEITNIQIPQVISDMFMKAWVTKTAELISSHGVPAYLYAFNYVSSTSSNNFTGAPGKVSRNVNFYTTFAIKFIL